MIDTGGWSQLAVSAHALQPQLQVLTWGVLMLR